MARRQKLNRRQKGGYHWCTQTWFYRRMLSLVRCLSCSNVIHTEWPLLGPYKEVLMGFQECGANVFAGLGLHQPLCTPDDNDDRVQ